MMVYGSGGRGRGDERWYGEKQWWRGRGAVQMRHAHRPGNSEQQLLAKTTLPPLSLS
jgi:hypothetical protein